MAEKKKKRAYVRKDSGNAQLDLEHLEKCASFMYTDDELALAMKVPLRSWGRYKDRLEVAAAIAEGRSKFKTSLRRQQIAMAMGDTYLKSNGVPWDTRARMMTHLGKQYLDQVEKVEHRGNKDQPIVTEQRVDSRNKAEYKKKFTKPAEVWQLLDAAILEKPKGHA